MKKLIRSAEEILAMSRNKMDVAADLEEITRPTIEHLIKLRLYSNTDYVGYWRKEVATFLCEVPRLKQSNKYPSKEFILLNTIDLNNDSIENCYKVVIADNDEITPVEHNYDELISDIYDYFDWIAGELSNRGKVARNEVVNKLSEMNF